MGMDVYRNFRRHFASGANTRISKAKGRKIKLGQSCSPPSPRAIQGRQSSSDVQLGLQNIVISVHGDDLASRHLVRLFVIPSTSGLAAGYSVSIMHISSEQRIFRLTEMSDCQDGDRVAYLKEAQHVISSVKDGLHVDGEGNAIILAENYLEQRILKTEIGIWTHATSPESEMVKKEEAT